MALVHDEDSVEEFSADAPDEPVGAENPVTSCDLQVFVDQPAEEIASTVPDVAAGGWGSDPSDWWLLI